MTNNNSPAEGSPPLIYRVKLPLSSGVVTHVSGLIRARCKAINSRWRKLNPGRQALLVLAFLRQDQRLADLAGGNDISASTLRRWMLEVIAPARRAVSAAGPRPEEDRCEGRRGGAAGRHPDPHPTPHRD
ncbi:hypothetical protein [Streptomyces flavidovirens]